MFAIAIWDAREQRAPALPRPPRHQASLLLLRRPAFRVRFRAQSAREGACRRASSRSTPSACYDFLGYRYVPAPKTLYKRCFKLPPAHELVYSPDYRELCRRRAATGACPCRTSRALRRSTAACEELRSLIGASVAEQMVADVPLGFFLSGGVDSSVVVAAAAATGTRVATFSIGFDADEVSETPFAREVAQRFGTDHHERILSQVHAQELLPRLKSWFDEPFADESAMPTLPRLLGGARARDGRA